MAYPGALIYRLDGDGLAPTRFEETEHYTVTRSFLLRPESFFKHLFGKEPEPTDQQVTGGRSIPVLQGAN